MQENHVKKRSLIPLGVASAIFGLIVLYLAGGDSGVPDRGALASATGQVQSVIKGKSSIGFSLKGDAHHFQYLSKSGELSIVYRALSGAEGEKVTVLFDPAQSGRPVFDDNDYHMTYEVGVSGRTLVSYERVRDAWQADKVAGNWLGMAFLLIGVALVVFSRLRQNAQQKEC